MEAEKLLIKIIIYNIKYLITIFATGYFNETGDNFEKGQHKITLFSFIEDMNSRMVNSANYLLYIYINTLYHTSVKIRPTLKYCLFALY